jgi:micrococcal nuclease
MVDFVWGNMGLFRLLVRLFARRGRWPSARTDGKLRQSTPFRARVEARVIVLDRPTVETVLAGPCWVIDGDTIVINKVHVRLAGIDAPELDHPWGQRSKWALVQLCKGQTVTARIKPGLSYDRLVAECFLPDGRDLAAELVRAGLALDWPVFSGGKYRHLEPAGARRKLWRAEARQRGVLFQNSERSMPD